MDSQQELVYEWEADFKDFNRPTLSLAECGKYVRTACARYEVPPPKIRAHRKGGLTFYQADKVPKKADVAAAFRVVKGSATISFHADGRNPAVALHEAAHAILNYWLPLGGVEDHGREFCGVYFWLLLRAEIMPEAALEASAKAAGIKWFKNFTPGRFHRWRQKTGSVLVQL